MTLIFLYVKYSNIIDSKLLLPTLLSIVASIVLILFALADIVLRLIAKQNPAPLEGAGLARAPPGPAN